jgi:hypothetical protein
MIKVKNWVTDPYELDLHDLYTTAKDASDGQHKVAFVSAPNCEILTYGVAVVWYTGEGTEDEIKEAFLKAFQGEEE